MSTNQSAADPFAALGEDLGRLATVGRRRALIGAGGIDFTSNDYLGLADSDELRQAAVAALARRVPLGAGGSRLLRGNHPEHEALERAAADFFGSESALYCTTGYAANLALFATAPQRGDLVVHDELIHASVRDGLRRGRSEAAAVRHNDPQAIDEEIARWRRQGGMGRAWIAVESLYSMDGDGPRIEDLDAVARRRDALLVLDEAHATGVLGPDGRGRAWTLEGREHVITIHTCGKALGTAGGLICAPRVVRDFLINRGRAFIFTTAPSPLIAAVTRESLALCARGAARRARLQELVAYASRELKRHFGLDGSGTHILPLVIGDDRAAVALAEKLRAAGYDVRAIRPPTVPPGTARLRIALTLNVDEAAITGLMQALAREWAPRTACAAGP